MPPKKATGQEPSRQQPRAPRLRAACNQCNVAKVKCTGEREGCTRCKTLHAECIYTESRVGRVPGIRAKSKRLEQQQRNQQREDEGVDEGEEEEHRGTVDEQYVDNDTEDVPVANQNPTVHPAIRHGPDPSQQGPIDWSQGWELSPAWLDVPMLDNVLLDFDDTVRETMTHTSGRANRHDVNAMAYEHESSSTSPSVLTPTASSSTWLQPAPNRSGSSLSPDVPPDIVRSQPVQQPAHPPLTPQTRSDVSHTTVHGPVPAGRGQISTRTDSECVMVCTHIIAVLENYLLCEPKTLYLILEPTRKAAAELRNLIQLQEQSRCDRCISLFTIILSQMADLLEAGTNSLPESGTGLLNAGILPGMQSNLGFGFFSLTSDEQMEWQSRIVRKEYRNVEQIVSVDTAKTEASSAF
ncbi:hypothetical protein GGR52DRAFT_539082 [Hypoxylon sp. FL1284]|nr:hypothetical protein GGR52DRAFT_539082 [Hypoxylon sp. FL1284]